MSFPPLPVHPDDRWVNVTAMGEAVPRYILAQDGREVAISKARESYALGRITLEQLERRIDRALRGRL